MNLLQDMRIKITLCLLLCIPFYMQAQQDTTQIIEKHNLGKTINTSYDDIIPIITVDGKTLYFTRIGHPSNIKPSSYDVWYAEKKADSTWAQAQNIGKPINNQVSNWVVSVSSDGNTLYLSQTYNSDGTYKGGGLSKSQRTKEGWSVPEDIKITNFYNRSRSFMNYFLSPNRKILLMSAERRDTKGLQDIYYSKLQDDGSYSAPVNLGDSINTNATECSPFLASDTKTLYFTSMGHKGLGKGDIFVSRRLDSTWQKWSKPQNLGAAFNTIEFDGFFTLPASGDSAYLVSYQNSFGKGDIFRIKMSDSIKPTPVILVSGKVLNSKNQQPLEASISYFDLETGKNMGLATSDPVNGKYKIVLPSGYNYGFLAEKDSFYSVSDNIDASLIKSYKEIERDLYLTPIEKGATIKLNNLFFDTGKAIIKPTSYPELNRLAKFLIQNPSIKIEIAGHTDSKGSAASNIVLSQQRAQSVKNYLVEKRINSQRITTKGYGERKPIADNNTKEGRTENRRVEIRIIEK